MVGNLKAVDPRQHEADHGSIVSRLSQARSSSVACQQHSLPLQTGVLYDTHFVLGARLLRGEGLSAPCCTHQSDNRSCRGSDELAKLLCRLYLRAFRSTLGRHNQVEVPSSARRQYDKLPYYLTLKWAADVDTSIERYLFQRC